VRAELDEQELDVSTGAGWSLVGGTGAHVRVFQLEESAARTLLERAEPLGSELLLDATDDGYDQQRVKKLTILGVAPTALQGMAALSVADNRWVWGRKHVKRSYNVRRRTGLIRRLGNGDLVPLAAQAQAADVAYAPWSLNPTTGQAWTAREVLEDILADLDEFEISFTLRGIDSLDEIDVEDLEIDDKLDAAIARALGYFGNRAGIYVNWDGDVVIYDRLDRGEEDALDTDSRPPIILTPLPAQQNRKNERPTKVRVLYDTLVEIRADFTETADASNPDGDDEDHARLDNVSHSPTDLVVDGENTFRGQILRLEEKLTAYADTGNNGAKPVNGLPNFSRDLLRRRWIAGDMINAWQDPSDPTQLWIRRWNQSRSDYRQRFRFTKSWRDRIRAYLPIQLAVQDPEDGSQNAAAAIYADYATLELARWWDSKTRAQETTKHVGIRNIPGNPAGLNQVVGTKIGDLTQSSAVLGIEDQDLGVLRIAFREEVQEGLGTVFPSACANPYTNNTALKDAPVLASMCDLTEDHQLSVILAVQPAVPNNTQQLYAVEIDDPSGTGEGPPIEVRIYPSILAARFGWPNAVAGQGTQVAGSGVINEETAWKSFDDGAEAVEAGYGPPLNFDQLQALAEAQAASVYAFYEDHVEGGLTTVIEAGQEIVGTLRSVSCEIRGALLTMDSPPERPRIDAVSLLPKAVRRVILRQVDLSP
jgi:hypothetical protein